LFILSISVDVNNKFIIFFSELKNLKKSSKFVAIFFTVFILSMGGVPPLPGFFTKIGIIFCFIFSQHFFFGILISFINLFSYFYSLRVLRLVFFYTNNLIFYKKYKPIVFFEKEHIFLIFFFFMITFINFFVLFEFFDSI
jgi:NADH:ubiquinone oxidoreductase subunit 2 (subunit N)